MSNKIRMALRRLEQVIDQSQGPIFSDADYGRGLRAFIDVCAAMEAQDQEFKLQAAEAARIEAEKLKARDNEALQRMIDELGSFDHE